MAGIILLIWFFIGVLGAMFIPMLEYEYDDLLLAIALVVLWPLTLIYLMVLWVIKLIKFAANNIRTELKK